MPTYDHYIYVKKHGRKFKGRSEYLKYLEGKKLTPKQTMAAQCYLCMGYYSDGGVDCGLKICPMYPYMLYNPDRIVKTKNLSKEAKVKLRARLVEARKKK